MRNRGCEHTAARSEIIPGITPDQEMSETKPSQFEGDRLDLETLMERFAQSRGTGAAFKVGPVRPLFEVRRRTFRYLAWGTGSVYDVTSDDQRFVVKVNREEQPTAPPISMISTGRRRSGRYSSN